MSSLKYFLTSGKYQRLSTLDKQLEILREKIRHYQELAGDQRFVWPEQCVVGKFMHFRKYDHDKKGLIEFLDERGLLPVVTTINWRDLSIEEQQCLVQTSQPVRDVLKFRPSSEYSIKKDELEEFKLQLSKLDINDLVWQWKERKVEYKILSWKWNWILLNSPHVISNSEDYKQFGTVKIKQLDPLLDMMQVFNSLDKEAFKKLCKVEEDLVIIYGLKGYYSLKEVRKYRTLIGFQSRYYLMELQDEILVSDMLENKLIRYSVVSQLMNEKQFIENI
ncbi:hypothetical protein [Paenibacillus albus]|uniref:Uncharacterized protein n=1 Tax=Paenibacillus albus TaxID=2495582 RepID=A0A3Q8X810_9BACL|nr:hypothetical protein [Paenibacillus albus]AZN42662.1 hypothetical protein EJC50_25445 [Paenibacillus albus]